MLKHWLKQIYQLFPQAATALLLLLFLSSCSDQGCIDADDFGEYESQTIEVPSNGAQDNCNYDSTKDLTDPDQGPGIKGCLTTGQATVTDENNQTQTSNPGCTAFPDATFTNICVSNCVEACLSNNAQTSLSAEPSWTSTDKRTGTQNSGVTIRPGSEIIIRATGSITAGDSLQFPSMYVEATDIAPSSRDSNWNSMFFDVKSGQTLDVKFSGRWNDGINNIGSGSGAVSNATYNGARRLAVYLIPQPVGYGFDATQASELAGTIGAPLLPDPAAWGCTYSGSDTQQADCGNKTTGYTDAGYVNADNSLANNAFIVSTAQKTAGLTTYGGFIRLSDDGIKDDNFDPFATAGVTCDNNGNCSNINNVSPDQGVMVGDASVPTSGADREIINTYPNAFKVSFKSLNNSCTPNITVSIKDANDNIIVTQAVPVTASSWSTYHFSLEPGYKVDVGLISSSYGNSINCSRALAARFGKYYELTMAKSGFVSFTNIGSGSSSGNCTIKGRIVNPLGSHQDVSASYTSDFYEYDDFATASSTDPISSLSVPTTNLVTTLSNRVYVRQGQVIRFSPASWNSTWVANGLTRQCGVGMAMKIEPRPALICRGKATETVPNPNCVPDYNSGGVLLGCQAIAPECTNDSPATNYCPITDCQLKITCINGTAPFYQKSCSLVVPNQPNNPSCTYSTNYTSATCQGCSNLMVNNGNQPAKNNISNIDQCYDLESYQGKVANIPLITGFSDTDLSDPTVSKGAKKIGEFNGDYGNLDNFSDTGKTDPANANRIFQKQTPLTFAKPGRLRFFVIDGDDFGSNLTNLASGYYSNNSSPGTSYSGTNGFKISPSSLLQFNNGDWLQARLCTETSNDDNNPTFLCKGLNPTPLAGQPKIIEINTPTSLTIPGSPEVYAVDSNYKFDPSGNLLRTSGATPSDCTSAGQGVTTTVGENYYCHTYQYFTDAALKAKSQTEVDGINANIQMLRLTFKIVDPETPNCRIFDPSDTDPANFDGIMVKNPYFDSSQSGTSGALCLANESPVRINGSPPTGFSACVKEFYCGNKYINNSGSYTVTVKVKSQISGAASSDIISNVIMPIINVMDGPQRNCSTTSSISNIDGQKVINPAFTTGTPGTICGTSVATTDPSCQFYCQPVTQVGQAERIYKLLIADPRYKDILTMLLVVMITFYGFSYLIGTADLTHSEIFGRVIKIGLIYLFVGESGWQWFNSIVVRFFKGGTDYLAYMMASSFDNSPELTQAIANNDYYDKSILFSSVDRVFGMFFSSAVQKKISALLFASIFGWAYLLIIYNSFLLYVYAVANAVLIYLSAQVFLSILFTLGPIFFVFTLFNQTKEMFDNWLKAIISFSLQQIFLLTTLAFFNLLMYEVIKMSLGYKICWDEVWTINIITRITLLSFWTIASLPPRTNAQSDVGNIGNPDGIPSLFSILFIWVIASLMHKFIEFMVNLAQSIGGGLSAVAMAKGVKDAATGYQKYMSDKMGKAWENTGGQAIQRLDKFFFDSGKMADKEREERKAAATKDASNISQLSKAGQTAISDYKQKNANEFAAMSKDKQREKLKEIRDNAMLKKAKEMGIEKDLDRLKAKKGFTYEGSNIFGALVHAANQDRKGQLSESLNEKEISTRFSEKESKKALQNLKNRDERKKFIAAAMQGKVDIGAEKNYFRKKLDSTKQQLKNIRAGKLSSEDYNMAEAQLIAEGEVTKMTKGTGWARSDAEKEMIRERVNLNKKQKEIKSDNANIKAIASLKTEEARLEDSKKFKEEVADLSFGKTISAYVKRAKDKAKSAIVTSATDLIMRKDGKSGAIKQQEAFAEARPEQARRVYQEKMAAGEQKAIQTKLASKLRDEISSLRDKKADKSLSTEQREDIDAKLQKANVAAHQTQNQIDNIVAREKQLENLEKFYGKYEPPAEQPKPAAVETKQPEPVPSAAPASSPPPPPSAPPKPEEKKS